MFYHLKTRQCVNTVQIQPYLSLLWLQLVTHFVTTVGPCLSMAKSHKAEAESIQPIIQSQNHANSYLWPQGHTHTQDTNIPTSRTKAISRNQPCSHCAPGSKIEYICIYSGLLLFAEHFITIKLCTFKLSVMKSW